MLITKDMLRDWAACQPTATIQRPACTASGVCQ